MAQASHDNTVEPVLAEPAAVALAEIYDMAGPLMSL